MSSACFFLSASTAIFASSILLAYNREENLGKGCV
jgi:hypothetical protein